MDTTVCRLASLAALFAPALLSAQAVSTRTPGQPTARLPQGFTRIEAIHELRDGRVLLLDADDRSVHVVSSQLADARQVGRTGSGPGEYQLPSRLFSLGGDSAAILDSPNGRLLVITPAAEPGGIIDLRFARSDSGGSRTPMPPPPQATDESGRMYARTAFVRSTANGRAELVDSAAIQRWRAGSSPDTAGFVRTDDLTRSRLLGRGAALSPLPPFSPVSRWTVAPDGRVAVLYPEPYHIVIYSADGIAREGPPILHDPIRVTEKHKQAYRESRDRPRPGLVGSVGNPGSAKVGMVRWPSTEPAEWREYLPPFTSTAAIRFAPDGNLWVERTTPDPDDRPVYDVIDGSGRLAGKVVLPEGRRLVGFGSRTMYLVRRDDMDLEYLERYRWPSPPVGSS